jgi:uncharacterized membrane protein (UPF0127 family)
VWWHSAWRAGAVVATIAFVALSACSTNDPTPSSTPSTTASARPASPTPSPAATGLPLTAEFTNSAGQAVTLSIEIADTSEERAIGLMNRESLAEDAGMLFDFQADVQTGFWMKNTLVPLSIAFIDKDRVIVHIEDMEPQTENLHFSPSLYRYAIEVNQGWYAENDIEVGDRVELNTG